MSGGQHRVDEVTRTESRGLDRKNNPRIAAHRPPKETAGLRNAGVCAKGTKKESNTLDAADLVRDVANRGLSPRIALCDESLDCGWERMIDGSTKGEKILVVRSAVANIRCYRPSRNLTHRDLLRAGVNRALEQLVRVLKVDLCEVVADLHARYYGVEVSERTLVPDDGAQLGQTRFADWLKQPGAKAVARPASRYSPSFPTYTHTRICETDVLGVILFFPVSANPQKP